MCFPPCWTWKEPSNRVWEWIGKVKWNGQFRTDPTEKSGPPREAVWLFRNFSCWTEMIDSVLDRNFRKVWLNGSHPWIESVTGLGQVWLELFRHLFRVGILYLATPTIDNSMRNNSRCLYLECFVTLCFGCLAQCEVTQRKFKLVKQLNLTVSLKNAGQFVIEVFRRKSKSIQFMWCPWT